MTLPTHASRPARYTAAGPMRQTKEPMDTATDDTTIAAAWIAEATRRLAGLEDTANPDVATQWAENGPALIQLRMGIAQRIAALPRRTRLIHTTSPGIDVSHTALAKLLTWALAEPAAAMAAAVADVEITVNSETLTAVYIHLIGVGIGERDRTYLQDGDILRAHGAKILHTATGHTSADMIQITTIWDDLIVPQQTSQAGSRLGDCL